MGILNIWIDVARDRKLDRISASTKGYEFCDFGKNSEKLMRYNASLVQLMQERILGEQMMRRLIFLFAVVMGLNTACYKMTDHELGKRISSENGNENDLKDPNAPGSGQMGQLNYLNKAQINRVLSGQLLISNPDSITANFGALKGGLPNVLSAKEATQVYITACEMAFRQSNPNRDRLVSSYFPRGSSDPSQLFSVFVGRLPTDTEAAIVNELVSKIRDRNKEAAACAAVASSVAALNAS